MVKPAAIVINKYYYNSQIGGLLVLVSDFPLQYIRHAWDIPAASTAVRDLITVLATEVHTDRQTDGQTDRRTDD